MKIKASGVLIDNLIKAEHKRDDKKINSTNYILRPKVNGKRIKLMNFIKRIRGCWRILRGKGLVIYYKEDE